MGSPTKIRDFILDNVEEHPESIARFVMKEFGVSRQVISHHIRNLIKEGLLVAEGETRRRKYELKPIAERIIPLAINSELQEHRVWMEYFADYIKQFKDNIISICNYGLTEMLNNAIDHSEGSNIVVRYSHFPNRIRLAVSDNGIGIFHKITRDFKLADEREAILELSKGKLTTDPETHTGEGIFFTTRMFDKFSVLSGDLYFSHVSSHDWLIQDREDEFDGTYIQMDIRIDSNRMVEEVFDEFSGEEYDYAFKRTQVPLFLAKYGHEKLVSRSQAKRILTRFDRFDEVFLDFEGVDFIGQAFADEIFRVYRQKHPETEIHWIRANPRIDTTIKTIINSASV